eukprot:TRINITY_DN3203_c0_g2_i1.p1 TRINITY_DN3203_c0_g2~~TRINITY_DN3203_c0_g2_i1.p1  ORF type:complete len:1422 (+),score=273.79 TRINITY_DN3203_c0_g2_i1:78-4343(+)
MPHLHGAPDGYLWFFGSEGELGCLSNSYPSPITLGGQAYPTVEHYFQSMKFLGSEKDMEEVRGAATPKRATKMGRDRGRPTRRDWEAVKHTVMEEALRAKFTQHPHLQNALLGTGDLFLVEHTDRDRYWGDGGAEDPPWREDTPQVNAGQNHLGRCLVALRAQLQREQHHRVSVSEAVVRDAWSTPRSDSRAPSSTGRRPYRPDPLDALDAEIACSARQYGTDPRVGRALGAAGVPARHAWSSDSPPSKGQSPPAMHDPPPRRCDTQAWGSPGHRPPSASPPVSTPPLPADHRMPASAIPEAGRAEEGMAARSGHWDMHPPNEELECCDIESAAAERAQMDTTRAELEAERRQVGALREEARRMRDEILQLRDQREQEKAYGREQMQRLRDEVERQRLELKHAEDTRRRHIESAAAERAQMDVIRAELEAERRQVGVMREEARRMGDEMQQLRDQREMYIAEQEQQEQGERAARREIAELQAALADAASSRAALVAENAALQEASAEAARAAVDEARAHELQMEAALEATGQQAKSAEPAALPTPPPAADGCSRGYAGRAEVLRAGAEAPSEEAGSPPAPQGLVLPAVSREGIALEVVDGPGRDSTAWLDLGRSGGGEVDGATFTEKECYEQALGLDGRNGEAWAHLARQGGGKVNGSAYSEKGCYEQVVGLDGRDGTAWYILGLEGGGEVHGCSYSKKQCYQMALGIDGGNSRAWHILGLHGGGVVACAPYSAKECHQRALAVDVRNGPAWFHFGRQGGGDVGGTAYSVTACYERALEIDGRSSAAWSNLGRRGGGDVNGTTYCEKACYQRALEGNDPGSTSWVSLGHLGGGEVHGVAVLEKECFERSLELDPFVSTAWRDLGCHGGGVVGGTRYSEKECYQKALDVDSQNGVSWNELARTGGGTLRGTDFSAEECYEKAHELREVQLEAAHPRDDAAAAAAEGEGATDPPAADTRTSTPPLRGPAAMPTGDKLAAAPPPPPCAPPLGALFSRRTVERGVAVGCAEGEVVVEEAAAPAGPGDDRSPATGPAAMTTVVPLRDGGCGDDAAEKEMAQLVLRGGKRDADRRARLEQRLAYAIGSFDTTTRQTPRDVTFSLEKMLAESMRLLQLWHDHEAARPTEWQPQCPETPEGAGAKMLTDARTAAGCSALACLLENAGPEGRQGSDPVPSGLAGTGHRAVAAQLRESAGLPAPGRGPSGGGAADADHGLAAARPAAPTAPELTTCQGHVAQWERQVKLLQQENARLKQTLGTAAGEAGVRAAGEGAVCAAEIVRVKDEAVRELERARAVAEQREAERDQAETLCLEYAHAADRLEKLARLGVLRGQVGSDAMLVGQGAPAERGAQDHRGGGAPDGRRDGGTRGDVPQAPGPEAIGPGAGAASGFSYLRGVVGVLAASSVSHSALSAVLEHSLRRVGEPRP